MWVCVIFMCAWTCVSVCFCVYIVLFFFFRYARLVMREICIVVNVCSVSVGKKFLILLLFFLIIYKTLIQVSFSSYNMVLLVDHGRGLGDVPYGWLFRFLFSYSFYTHYIFLFLFIFLQKGRVMWEYGGGSLRHGFVTECHELN